MRENRLYGSEGGEVKSLPYPYQTWAAHLRLSLDCFALARNDGSFDSFIPDDTQKAKLHGSVSGWVSGVGPNVIATRRLCRFQFCIVRLQDVRRLFLSLFRAAFSRVEFIDRGH